MNNFLGSVEMQSLLIYKYQKTLEFLVIFR